MQVKISRKSRIRFRRMELEVLVRVECDVDWDRLWDQVAAIIANAAPTTMTVAEDRLWFTASFWRFVPRPNLLNSFASGEVRMDRQTATVLYCFSLQRFLWEGAGFCLAAPVIPAIALMDPSWLWLGVPIFCFAVVSRLFLTPMRIGELTYRAVRSALRQSGAPALVG